MRKTIFLYLMLLPLSILANTTPNGQPILYCPESVVCNEKGNIDSCHLSDNLYNIWRNTPFNGGSVAKGTYKLKTVISSYESGGGDARCVYNFVEDTNIEKLMTVLVDNEYSPNWFNAYIGDSSQWVISGWEAECQSQSAKQCPLTEIAEIAYRKNKNNQGNDGFDRGVLGGGVQTILRYNELLSICGATSSCQIKVGKMEYSDSRGSFFTTYGMVTIDITMPDTVKIEKIDTTVSAPCVLKSQPPFNTIYCDPKILDRRN